MMGHESAFDGGFPDLPESCRPSGWALLLPGGRLVRIPECGLLVGRGSVSDVWIEDEKASRRHMLLAFIAGTPWAIDQGSTNGTLCDHLPLDRKRLAEESHHFLVGETELEWVRDPGSAEGIDDILPRELATPWKLWLESSRRRGRAATASDALREIAAAASCRFASDGSIALSWADGDGGSNSLGPLRRQLLDHALRQIPTR